MNRVVIAAGLVGVLAHSPSVFAQQVEGFATVGLQRDVNDRRFPSASGGVLLSANWLALGAQADAFFSPPYVAGRGTLFVQGNVLGSRRVRPFVLGGWSFGEFDGTMLGAGVDVRPARSRVGVRATVQTYRTKVSPWFGPQRTDLQPSMNIGIVWR